MSFLMGVVGHYRPTPIPAEFKTYQFDVVIACSFGTSTEFGSPNAEIRYYADNASSSGDGCPLIADEVIAASFCDGARDPEYVIEGNVTNLTANEGLGTWGTLQTAQSIMKSRGLKKPLLVGQAFHVNRIALQARRLGMDPVVPPGLPQGFDRKSKQIWTRALPLWIPRESLGALVLKTRGEL